MILLVLLVALWHGTHDQRTHGRGRGGGPKIKYPAPAFTKWNPDWGRIQKNSNSKATAAAAKSTARAKKAASRAKVRIRTAKGKQRKPTPTTRVGGRTYRSRIRMSR